MELLLIYKKEKLKDKVYYILQGIAPCMKDEIGYTILSNKFDVRKINLIDNDNVDEYQGYYVPLLNLFEEYNVSSIEELLEKLGNCFGDIYEFVDGKLEETYEIEYVRDKICDKIVGQDNVVEELLSVIYNNIIIRDYSNEEYDLLRKNALIIGTTGVGKTKIIKEIETNLDIPISYIDIGRMTEKEFIGKIVNDLVVASNGDLEKASHGIVVIDNLEENREDIRIIGEKVVTSDIINFDFLLRPSILDVEMNNESYSFDTSKLTVIFILNNREKDKTDTLYNKVGFNTNTSLEDLLLSKGITHKGLLSITNIIYLNNFTKEDYKKILLNSSISPLFVRLNELCNMEVFAKADEELIDFLVEQAFQKNIGVYGLINSINELFRKYDYDMLNGKVNELDFSDIQRVRKV